MNTLSNSKYLNNNINLTPIELEKANNLHKDILNKINHILHRKNFSDNFTNKLKKSTVLCFDDISINNKEDNVFIDEKIEEFLALIKKEIGDFVDWNPEKKKDNNSNNRFNDINFFSKNILRKAFTKDIGINSKNFLGLNFLKNTVKMKNSSPDLKKEKLLLKNLDNVMANFLKESSNSVNKSNEDETLNLQKRIHSLDHIKKKSFFLTNLENINNQNITKFNNYKKDLDSKDNIKQ